MSDIDYLLMKFPAKLQRLSKPLGIFTSFFAVGFLGVTDYLTGDELAFSIFYLLPISFTTLFAGGIWGAITALTCACVWL